jgi:hypothetical protein
MRTKILVGSLVMMLVGILSAACSATADDPCAGAGSYTGADICSKLGAAVLAKCPGATFDCDKLLQPQCTSTKTFCKSGVDKSVTDINAAADCDAALKAQFAYTCF